MAQSTKYQPGTPLDVGSHKIKILKYISQGGFAHVYSCAIDPPFHNNTVACLKRVVVPNKVQLALLRQEVDAMKRLRGNTHIVSYIDSHASRLPVSSPDEVQQYEVLLLMEYCSGKGLIDFLNTRLTNRPTEHEILTIMWQITAATAMCHHLSPPLIHRDIKIENVLMDGLGLFKLCDFGSAVEYSPPPNNQHEFNTLYESIMHHTTPQYRSPEMIDLTRAFPIDDKLDIWALGVFLYKLCYFTTPFELPTQKSLRDLEQSILSCSSSLHFPAAPYYSPRLKNVIKCCLREDPRRRPSSLQLLQEVAAMLGLKEMPEVIPYSVRLSQARKLMDITNLPQSDPKATVKAALHSVASEPSFATVKAKKEAQLDAFALIDKSKILLMGNLKTSLRPKSQIYLSKHNQSSPSVYGLGKTPTDAPTHERNERKKSREFHSDTIDFLRSKEETSTIHTAQTTGGSIKAAIITGLRKVSTGGSIGSQRSGSLYHFKRASSSGTNEPEEVARQNHSELPAKRNSIKRRMHALLNNRDSAPSPKTASGYGKYTDQDDISSINQNNLSTSSVNVAYVANPQTSSS